ncbi:MAG: barstar family protein [Leptospira sp.]|nr:barstar family protein [Leptospira sp.]
MHQYNIKTIDLGDCKSGLDVHMKFSQSLNFPTFYGNNWDAFWDAITGLVEMPSNLIIYNFSKFKAICLSDAKVLIGIIDQFNEENKPNLIQLDSLEGLEKNNISSIFKKRPLQFGLRGDSPLWDNLENAFVGQHLPKDEEELIQEIHNRMEILMGSSTEIQKDIYSKKYDSGGMSGGMISWEFWERNAIPLLIGRYRKLFENF